MKRFQFKLQAVLTLRQRAEHEALGLYARTLQAGQAAREKLGEAEAQLSEARRRWLHALADGIPAARAAQMRDHNQWLGERKKLCEQEVRLAEAEIEQASRKMIQARQQREAVEKHFDHQREQYDRAVAGEERRFLDDLVQARTRMESEKAGKREGENDRATFPTNAHLNPPLLN